MNKGWVSIDRKIQNHWLWEEKREFSKLEAWLDILLNVNHSKQKVMIKNTLFIVNRGDSINSLDTWAKRWKWNKSKVRRFLTLLENDLMIETKNEHKTTRLTVCKYDSYQHNGNANETQMKRKRNADETQMTPNNNDNNINNINNDDVKDSLFDIDTLKEKYLSNKQIVEAVIKEDKNKIKDFEDLNFKLDAFCKDLKQQGRLSEKFNEFTRYFLNCARSGKYKKPNTPSKKDFIGNIYNDL